MLSRRSTLEPYFDGVIDEQCNEYSERSSFSSYLNASKPVLNAEYSGGSSFCAADNAAGIMGALYSLVLDGSTYTPCFAASPQGPAVTSGDTGTGGGSDRTPPSGTTAAPPAGGETSAGGNTVASRSATSTKSI
jgi:hypothetical protein